MKRKVCANTKINKICVSYCLNTGFEWHFTISKRKWFILNINHCLSSFRDHAVTSTPLQKTSISADMNADDSTDNGAEDNEHEHIDVHISSIGQLRNRSISSASSGDTTSDTCNNNYNNTNLSPKIGLLIVWIKLCLIIISFNIWKILRIWIQTDIFLIRIS